MDRKVASLLSLCKRAGKLSVGEFACENALRSLKARLVIISADASLNTKKKFTNKAYYYKVPAFEYATKEELGKAVGSANKAVAAICDENFSSEIIKLIGSEDSAGIMV